MQQYLSVDEGDIWVRRMRFLYCPEEALIEQDISELLEFFIPEKLNSIDRLIESLSGGGIIPGAMRARVLEIREESERLLDVINKLTTPIVGVV